jgi:hypothetical protein
VTPCRDCSVDEPLCGSRINDVRVRRGIICEAVLLSVLGCSGSLSPSASYGLEEGFSKWAQCANEEMSFKLISEYTKLVSPADGATVQVGSPVTLVGESGGGKPLTFEVASSPSSLSTPDVDSGLGTLQPYAGTPSVQYAFTSTKAAATPRMIYWAVSFSESLSACAEPVHTYRTPARALTVLPAPSTPTSASTPPSASTTPATSATVSTAQITALLVGHLRPSATGARIGALLKGGIAIAFTAPEAGAATIAWYYLPPGAKLSKATKPVLVASGQLTFSAAGTAPIKVKPTAVGRRLLKHAGRIKLTAKGTFTPTGMTPIIATRTFVLRR